jgi:hypothetical protein
MRRKEMRVVIILITLLFRSGAFSRELDAFFPEARLLAGWSRQEKPKHFQSQNLYEYIDGEAELYLSYDFKELSTSTYFKGSPEDTFITVDCYDMGTLLNAFGLYASYRYPGYVYEKIGTEGFLSDFGLTFFKGRYVVEIKTSDVSEICRDTALRLSRIISGRIPDGDGFPLQAALMPEARQVPYSLKYFAKDMLNQAFLQEGLEAKYNVGDEEATGFAVLFKRERDAGEGLKKLKQFFVESGADPVSHAFPAETAFAFKTPYHGFTLLELNGKIICGVQDLSSPENGLELMAALKKSTMLKGSDSEGHGTD